MIDTHAHLEQKDYHEDVDQVVARCRAAGLKGIISVATSPSDFNRGLEIAQKHKKFVFLGAGVHPEYVKEFSEAEIEKAIEWIRENEKHIVGIGEQGLDYFWVKEPAWREKQKEMFAKFIELSKELDKVLIVHTRDAHDEVINILQKHRAERVHLHMWGGSEHVDAINDHEWNISVGPVSATSKKHKKVIKDVQLERIMLETDSPWFGGKDDKGNRIRGEPTNIKIPAQVIAEVKEIPFEDVWKQCGKNAMRMFSLPRIVA